MELVIVKQRQVFDFDQLWALDVERFRQSKESELCDWCVAQRKEILKTPMAYVCAHRVKRLGVESDKESGVNGRWGVLSLRSERRFLVRDECSGERRRWKGVIWERLTRGSEPTNKVVADRIETFVN